MAKHSQDFKNAHWISSLDGQNPFFNTIGGFCNVSQQYPFSSGLRNIAAGAT